MTDRQAKESFHPLLGIHRRVVVSARHLENQIDPAEFQFFANPSLPNEVQVFGAANASFRGPRAVCSCACLFTTCLSVCRFGAVHKRI